MGNKNRKSSRRGKVIPAINIPPIPNPIVPDLEEYDEFDLYHPVQYYTYKKPVPEVDPAQKLFLEKQLVSHYIETIPEDCNKKIAYVMQGDGLFEQRTNKIGKFFTKISDVNIPGLKSEMQAGWELNVPKIPASYLGTIVSFFRSICNKYASEVFLQLFYDCEKEEYLLHCPKQTIGGASVNYTNDEVFEDQDKILVFEIHSHVNMDAFFSGTDDGDEKADRFYGVIGKVSQYFPEIKLRVMMGGRSTDIEVEDIFNTDEEMYHMESYPKDWVENIKEEKNRFPIYDNQQWNNYGVDSFKNGGNLPHYHTHNDLVDKFTNGDHLLSNDEFVSDEDSVVGYWMREDGVDWYVESGEKLYYKDPTDGELYYPVDDDLGDPEEEMGVLNHRGLKF